MANEERSIIKQEAVIASKIITLRDEKVILDVHLAELYDVENRALKQAVRRNRDCFPDDFMYKLTDDEVDTMTISLLNEVDLFHRRKTTFRRLARNS